MKTPEFQFTKAVRELMLAGCPAESVELIEEALMWLHGSTAEQEQK